MMIWRISKGSPGIQTKFDSLRGPVAGSQWVSRLCHPAKLQQPSLFGHLITSNKIALLSNSFNLLPAWPSQPQPCFLMQHQQASKRYFSFSLGSTMSQQTWLLSSIAFVLLKKLVPNCQGRIVRNLGHPRPARKQRRGTHPLKSNASPAPANYIKLWVCHGMSLLRLLHPSQLHKLHTQGNHFQIVTSRVCERRSSITSRT